MKPLMLLLVIATSDDQSLVFHPDGTLVSKSARAGPAETSPPSKRSPRRRSPDGKSLAYVSLDGESAIRIADADGKNPRRLTPEGLSAGMPSWSPDSRRIAFVALRGAHWQVHVIDADGENLTQLTFAPEGTWMPRFSPDGRLSYLRYYPREGKLQRSDLVVVDGDESKAVVKNLFFSDYGWSPDGKTIAVGTYGALLWHDLATGKTERVPLTDIDPRLDTHAARRLTFSPDGQSLACTITFLGGQQKGGPKIYGDDELFIVRRDGKPTAFQPGAEVESVEWRSQ